MGHNPKLKVSGHAGTFPLEPKYDDKVRYPCDDDACYRTFPEAYWNFGELAPCTGAHEQRNQNNSQVCYDDSVYQNLKSLGESYSKQEILLALMVEASERWGDLQGATGDTDKLKQFRCGEDLKCNHNAGSSELRNQQTPMFSIEALGGNLSCINTRWGSQTEKATDRCGTVRAFGNDWTWDEYVDFLKLFAYAHDIDSVGVYDIQFLQDGMIGKNMVDPAKECFKHDACKAGPREYCSKLPDDSKCSGVIGNGLYFINDEYDPPCRAFKEENWPETGGKIPLFCDGNCNEACGSCTAD